jgi:hypothetical protein
VDFNRLIARARAILVSPRTEWPVSAAEAETVAGLYKNYILVLAAIPAVAGFIKTAIFGYGAMGITIRVPFGSALASAIVSYVLSLVLVYVVALIVDALAPNFGGQKSPIQALKVVAYAYTASWVAGIGLLIPWLGWLIALAGGIYAIYLLYLGLPVLRRAPQGKAGASTAGTGALARALGGVSGLVVAGMTGTAALMSGAATFPHSTGSNVTIDRDSALGKLEAWGKQMEEAGKKMEAAQKSGDSQAQSDALGAVMGAALGGGGQVEALGPDVLKPFLPERLAGLPRTDFAAERNAAMGMQMSEAKATYSDGDGRSLHLEIQDLGSAKGLLALAGFAALGTEKESDGRYEKTYRQGDRLVTEKWDSHDQSGEYGMILGDRFSVKVSGNADDMNQLKAALASVDLARLEALKDQGVKRG